MNNKIIPLMFFGLLLVFFLYVGYLLFYPVTVTAVDNKDNVQVLNKILYPGDDVIVNFSYCKYEDISPKFTRMFVDTIYYETIVIGAIFPKGCATTEYHVVKIPDSLPAGTYYLLTNAEYKINPIRTIRTTWRTEQFEVKNKIGG